MPELRLSQNVISFNAAISSCQRSGRWNEAIGLLQRMLCHKSAMSFQPDLVSFNSTMASFQLNGEWRQSLGMLDLMGREKLQPDVVSFSIAITSCEKGGQWQHALTLFDEMCKRSLNCLIQTPFWSFPIVLVCFFFNMCFVYFHFLDCPDASAGSWPGRGLPLRTASARCSELQHHHQLLWSRIPMARGNPSLQLHDSDSITPSHQRNDIIKRIKGDTRDIVSRRNMYCNLNWKVIFLMTCLVVSGW